MNNFKYIIFNKNELNLINISELLSFSADPVRLSNDNTHGYAKYIGSMPDSIQNLTTKSQEYTHEQMQVYFEKENWPEIPYY